MNNQATTIDESILNQVDELENVSTYDLADVTDNPLEIEKPHFKEPEPEPEQQKTKKRGRPAKMSTPQVAPEPAKPWGLDETENFVNEPQYISEPSLENVKLTLDNIIPGDVLLTVIDKAMSVLLPLALNTVAGTKLKPADFKLTAEEKKTLKPSLEACAKTIPINFSNPWVALGVTAVAVYGAKTVDKINFDNIDAEDLGPKVERRGRPRKNN